tara:strand:+ start:351 stop:1217 length:867 start_codon:yes stop_codon:yes gene_type:complete
MIKQLLLMIVMLTLTVSMPLSHAYTMNKLPAFKVAPAVTAPAEPAPVTASEEKSEAKPTSTDPDTKVVVAHVVWVKGTFKAIEPGTDEVRTLKKSSNVYMNDTLVTDANSEAQIVFTDDSNMAFRPDTRLYINQYNYIPKKNKKTADNSVGKYIMDLVEGGFRTITGYIAKEDPEEYQVNTPVATIGVRGTEFSVVYQDGKLYMKQYKGKPCMKNKDGEEKSEICLDNKNKFSEAEEGSDPVYLADEPAVFNVDVEVVPVTFSNTGDGFCGIGGCGGDGGGGSGFCIQ